MATINPGGIIQSRFIGSPISVPVTASNPSGNVTFHRVRLKIMVADAAGVITADAVELEFSKPVSNLQTVWFDVSSAFRAYVDGFIPMPTVFEYPSLTATIEAFDDYLIDGISYEGQDSSGEYTISGKYIGALTDRERGGGITEYWSEPERYSRKPVTCPEICFIGKSMIYPGTTGINAPAVTVHTIEAGANTTYNYYGTDTPRRGYEIRFINSLGVHENIFVSRLSGKDVNINTEKYVIARQESLTRFSRGTTVKQNDYETWKFSSGALDEAWASWFIHEFLMAKWVWIYINGMWIPCHTIPDENTTLVNEEDASLIEVQFAIQMDINGSPL